MKANQSKAAQKRINKIWKIFLFCCAGAMAIGALKYNPWHLFTAGLVFLTGLETDIKIIRNDEIC